MACGCKDKNKNQNYIYTDDKGTEHVYVSNVAAKAAQIRGGGTGTIRSVPA